MQRITRSVEGYIATRGSKQCRLVLTTVVPAKPRINADAPLPFSAPLGFTSRLSLVANSTSIRAPVMRNVVRHLKNLTI